MDYDETILNLDGNHLSLVKQWIECKNETHRLDPSDPLTPAYMRSGMTDLERAVTLRDAVVFGATVEVKGENLENMP